MNLPTLLCDWCSAVLIITKVNTLPMITTGYAVLRHNVIGNQQECHLSVLPDAPADKHICDKCLKAFRTCEIPQL